MLSRPLCCSLACPTLAIYINHSWVSFSGFSESYNGTFKLTRHTGLSAKNVSSAFFNGELENKMREHGHLDMFNMVKVDSDKDKVLAEIEKLRRKEPYEHRNCHANCKAKAISCHVHLTKKTTLKELMRHKKYGLVSSNQYTQKEILQLEAVGHGHGGDPEDRQQNCSESTLLLPGNCFDCHNSHRQHRLSAFFRNLQFSIEIITCIRRDAN
ncbi:uncharacterized protein LOC110990737 [Acanthaster planci]|uniref:Uncharacterized protein LOC110990737 n=1 Tax=Acanthaster planci TaxID=133434 RepID=A0A8B8A6B8_ACAPL|nr:uncharacterized protein LOC110990737 [Acanthaster planci]